MRYLFFLLLLPCFGVSQQDTIFKKDNSYITGTITLVNDKNIFYSTKKEPSGVIELSKVSFYNYQSKRQKVNFTEDASAEVKPYTSDTIFRNDGGIIVGTITLINNTGIFYSNKKEPSGYIELIKVADYTYRSARQKVTFYIDTIPNKKVFVDGVDINALKLKYCEIIGTNATLLTRTHIGIDYGQGLNYNKTTKIAGENGTIMDFSSVADALNFMDRSGWEFVSSNVFSPGNSGIVYFSYLLKRKK